MLLPALDPNGEVARRHHGMATGLLDQNLRFAISVSDGSTSYGTMLASRNPSKLPFALIDKEPPDHADNDDGDYYRQGGGYTLFV